MDFTDVILGSALGAGVITLIIETAKIYFQYRLDNKKTEKLTKRELAKQVVEVLSEAKHGNYRNEPKNEERLTFIIEQLNLHDGKMAKLLQAIINSWILCATFTEEAGKLNAQSKENEKLIGELQKLAVGFHETLTRKLKKWK